MVQAIAYPFELKEGVSCTYANENKGQPCGFVESVYGAKRDYKPVEKIRSICLEQFVQKALP